LGRVLYPSESTQRANEGREELAAVVIDRVDDNVLTGSGFAYATQAHNVYLQVLDIGGVLGVLSFAGLAGAILRSGLRGRRDRLVAGALAAYAGYLVSGLVANSLWDRWLWFPIVIGLAARAASTPSERAVRERQPLSTGAVRSAAWRAAGSRVRAPSAASR
jgi:hypothetical protein